jgi:hypothetical protein
MQDAAMGSAFQYGAVTLPAVETYNVGVQTSSLPKEAISYYEASEVGAVWTFFFLCTSRGNSCYVYVYIYIIIIYIYMYMYIYICICIYIYIHTYIHTYMHVYVYMYMYECVCVRVHIYLYLYLYMLPQMLILRLTEQ